MYENQMVFFLFFDQLTKVVVTAFNTVPFIEWANATHGVYEFRSIIIINCVTSSIVLNERDCNVFFSIQSYITLFSP